MGRWVLTRERGEGDALAAELQLTLLPCIERRELPWPTWPASPLVFVTSAFVARRLRSLPWPVGLRIAALAPATAALLPEAVVTAAGGAQALAHAVARWAEGRPPLEVLYPTSDVGLSQPEQLEAAAVLSRVGAVHRVAVYSTRAPQGLAEALSKHRGGRFVFFSPSAVRHFLEAGGVASQALCVGQSTARAWPHPNPLLASVETVRTVLEENP